MVDAVDGPVIELQLIGEIPYLGLCFCRWGFFHFAIRLYRFPLKTPIKVWSNNSSEKIRERKDLSSAGKSAGYDIQKGIYWLQDFYLKNYYRKNEMKYKENVGKYYIGYNDLIYRHAGSKAKLDIGELLKQQGYLLISLPKSSKHENPVFDFLLSALTGLRRILKLLFYMPHDSIIVINHPFDFVSLNFAFFKIIKHNKVILINHDLSFLRATTIEELKNEPPEKYKKIYNLAAGLIVPIPTIPILKEIGVSSCISPLKLFPYLHGQALIKDRSFSKSVAFTGNLKKSEFIQKWLDMPKSYFVELIGLCDEDLNVGMNAIYKGSFDADIVPSKIEASFGLVWDGNDIASCGGVFGSYLHYNCPHKLSLYLAVGIPVFIWREAGMAQFVEKNEIGFAIDKLSDIENILTNMTLEEYQQLQENIKPIQRKITNGEFFIEALECITSKISTSD